MGVKKLLESHPIFSVQAVTSTNTYASPKTSVKNTDNIGIHVAWTGTMTGTLSVLASIDDVTYDSLTFTPALSQPAGSALSYLINLNQIPYLWVKLQYVNTSGSGVMNAQICAKDLN